MRLKLEAMVDNAVKKTAFARDWRNRRLAHTELDRSKPLASTSRKQAEDALYAIRKIMNQLEQTYLNKTVSYQHTIPDLGGVASLIAVIRKGVDTRRAEREANIRGTVA